MKIIDALLRLQKEEEEVKMNDNTKLIDYKNFVLKLDDKEIILYIKKIDQLGNHFVEYVTRINTDPVPSGVFSSRDGDLYRILFLELIHLKQELENLKFHVKLEEKLK